MTGPEDTRRPWAERELGTLLEQAWHEGDPVVTDNGAPTWSTTSGWEVERMPSEAEGGIVGLILNGTVASAASPAAPDTAPVTPDFEGSDLARLTELLERLPARSAPRLTPSDVTVDAQAPQPPAVWFWGDDNIYPGRVAGATDTARPRRRRRA